MVTQHLCTLANIHCSLATINATGPFSEYDAVAMAEYLNDQDTLLSWEYQLDCWESQRE